MLVEAAATPGCELRVDRVVKHVVSSLPLAANLLTRANGRFLLLEDFNYVLLVAAHS